MIHSTDFIELREFVNLMNSSNSTNHKIEILSDYVDHTFIKKVLLYTYHPYLNFGVTSANLKKRSDLINPNSTQDLFVLLNSLNDRRLTGHDAISEVNGFIGIYQEWTDLIYQIIDHNLETRATTTIINRVFNKLIPTFDVALAHDAAKVKGVDLFDGTFWLARKLDGSRLITIIEGESIRFFSRNGKEFLTLGKVADEIRRLGLTDLVLDGEICLMNEEGSDDFQGILKELQKKDHTIENPKYIVFDILTPHEFNGDNVSPKLSDRLANRSQYLGESLATSIIEVLHQTRLDSEDILFDLKETSKSQGWEGLIARRDVPYSPGRSKDMLKIKDFFDAEYQVIDLIMKPQRIIVNGREVEEEMLSAVIIEHLGSRVNVGSGFTIEQRQHYYRNPTDILSNIIKVQYFESTTDQHGNHSLRFPVFKGNYGKERSI
jgi:DNA ligase-1